ncbi:MAG: purple acid phosphatase 3 [Acidobacteria bacterium]|nr:purple acid phosphatase 3 [Acidobacteriota bacterium]
MRRYAPAIALLFVLKAGAAPIIELPRHTPLRFVVTGDAGASHSALRAGILAVAQRMRIDGILLVGDNFYPCGIDGLTDPQWTKITQHFGPSHLPIYPVLGNHDYGDQQERGGKDYWTCGHPSPGAEIAATGTIADWHFPARNYLLRSPLVDLVMLDTQPVALAFAGSIAGSDTGGQEVSWLARTLRDAGSGWRIVVGHHTIFSSGMHGRTNDKTQQRMRALLPLLRKERVDLYICGHDHDLELVGDVQRRNGDPLFLVSGAGSGLDELRPRKRPRKGDIEPPTIYPPPTEKAYLGFAIVEIAPRQLSITFYDKAGTQTGGPFTITKHAH